MATGDQIDWGALEDLHMTSWDEEQLQVDTDPFIQPQWEIPEKISISVALSGGGSRLHNANPNQPRNLDEIYQEAVEVIDVGPPSNIHFDLDGRATKTADGEEFQIGDAYMHLIKPLLEEYGRENVVPHLNCMHGTFFQQMLPVVTELAELIHIHSGFSPTYLDHVMPLLEEHGVTPELSLHNNSEIEANKRTFLDSGLVEKPSVWSMHLGAAPRRHPMFGGVFAYYPNELDMAQRFALAIKNIREVDPEATITVIYSGRPSRYLVTLAIIMGCHIRMGMEDTVWKYPHSDELIENNAETVEWAFDMARKLGREPVTPNEFREEMMGAEPRNDGAETLKPIPEDALEYTDLVDPDLLP